jgi:hypothetical protein
MKQISMAFSVFLLCSLAFPSLEAQEITDDLVLAFSFESGTGNTVKDLSGQGNDGKIEGNPQWVDGKLGGALHFDGSTYVVAPYIKFNDVDFTVQLWVKPEMATEQEIVFSQHEVNNANLSLHFRVYSNGTVRLGYYSNDLDTAAAALKIDEWANLTFRVDAKTNERKIYINGNEVASDTSASAYLGAKGETRIGGWERPTKAENPFYQIYHGTIDEVRVWHRLLNEDEILGSMETEMPVEPMGKAATAWGAVKR